MFLFLLQESTPRDGNAVPKVDTHTNGKRATGVDEKPTKKMRAQKKDASKKEDAGEKSDLVRFVL